MDSRDEWIVNRREFLKRSALIGLSAPALTTLLAACGDDDDEATATAGGGEGTTVATASGDATAAATGTTAEGEPTATGEMTEPSPTAGGAEETPSEVTTPSGGTFVEGGDRTMGIEFEEGTSGGTIVETDTCCITAPFDFTGALGSDRGNIRLTFEPLIEPNPFTLEPVGCLAESWEISEDSLTWTFFLREGVTFHDGEPFTSADVEATYALLGDERSLSQFVTQIQENVAGITVVDELTIAIATPAVLPDFLFDGAMFLIGAAHILEGIDPADFSSSDAATGADPSMVVGTGPFKAVEVVTDDHVTLARFDDYWDGAPYADEWIYRQIPDDASIATAVLAGEIDYLRIIQNTYVPQMEAEGFTLDPRIQPEYDCILLNLENPLFQDKLVRQALMYALDRQAIIDSAYEGVSQIAETILVPVSAFANPEGVTVRYEYDPEQAMALLDEAGWVPGADGVREKDGQRLAFSLYAEAPWAPWVAQVTVAQESWRQIGVEVELELTTYDTMFEQIQSGNFEASIWEIPGGITPDRSPNFLCDASTNLSRYCNEEVDAILTEARSEQDEARRIELYTQFQNIVLDDLPVLPTVYPEVVSLTAPRVHNPPHADVEVNILFAAEKIWIEQ